MKNKRMKKHTAGNFEQVRLAERNEKEKKYILGNWFYPTINEVNYGLN